MKNKSAFPSPPARDTETTRDNFSQQVGLVFACSLKMEGAVPFYQNPTSGDTATSVCILFGLVAALGGLGSAVLNFKDTSGAAESIQSTSPEVSGIKSRVKHFDDEVKSERTPLASFPSGITPASRTEGDSEFIDNVNTFVRGVAHGSQTFLSSQFGICSGFVFVCTLLVFVAIISWANDDVKFAGLCFLAFVVGSASSLLAAVLCRFLALRLASRVTTLLISSLYYNNPSLT